jgi:hypothetical protein
MYILYTFVYIGHHTKHQATTTKQSNKQSNKATFNNAAHNTNAHQFNVQHGKQKKSSLQIHKKQNEIQSTAARSTITDQT